MRNLDNGGFDYLVAVLLTEDSAVQQMWRFPFELVREHARYRSHFNGYLLHVQGALLRDPRAEQLGQAEAASL